MTVLNIKKWKKWLLSSKWVIEFRNTGREVKFLGCLVIWWQYWVPLANGYLLKSIAMPDQRLISSSRSKKCPPAAAAAPPSRGRSSTGTTTERRNRTKRLLRLIQPDRAKVHWTCPVPSCTSLPESRTKLEWVLWELIRFGTRKVRTQDWCHRVEGFSFYTKGLCKVAVLFTIRVYATVEDLRIDRWQNVWNSKITPNTFHWKCRITTEPIIYFNHKNVQRIANFKQTIVQNDQCCEHIPIHSKQRPNDLLWNTFMVSETA